jgi:hypothetical protein
VDTEWMIVLSWVAMAVRLSNDVGDGIDRDPRGDLSGLMSSHAVRHDAQLKRLVNDEAIFVGGPNAAFISHAVRPKHEGRVVYRTGGSDPVVCL